ncbi:MAG: hypothetical protein EOP11_02400 [Proteobacteria bacterium]|nr:MAG: hypothetical protein EOP11_02400 [Pseudomonadota bacterium]
MADTQTHPEVRGERNPLKSNRLKKELMKNEENKPEQTYAGGADVNLPSPGTEIPAGDPTPSQPNPGDPVPVQQ